MKKMILTLGVIIAAGSVVYADGNAFTPLNFNDTQYGTTTTVTNTNSAPALRNSNTAEGVDLEAIGNGNIQNAIQQLDNAQMDIRNDLLNCKTKFADVDAQYKLVKSERAALKKQISSIERRIRDIDRAKEKIRQNML
ncbi:hypothetical protein IJ750_00330 [bacterium]|nr:hypothetical protein [bacterium]